MKMEEKKMSKEAESLAGEIMELSRNVLLVRLRFLEPAFFQLKLVPDPSVTYATDGWSIRYGFLHVLRSYQIGKGLVSHDYLHMLFHNIFHHPFVGKGVDPYLWNLAADVAVEASIRELNLPETACPRDGAMEDLLEQWKKEVPFFSAETLYHYFTKLHLTPEEAETLREPFLADEHEAWYEHTKENSEDTSHQDDDGKQNENPGNEPSEGQEEEKKDGQQQNGGQEDSEDVRYEEPKDRKTPLPTRKELQKEWKEISSRIQTDLETASSKWGDKAGTILHNLKACTKEKADYAQLLRRFSVLGETIRTNDEEFDYIYYTYGLHLYGNVPLIEPLEYQEVRRIRDFVIVLDTSASVDGDLVQAFVKKTWNILSQEENFFKKFNLHIIQADTKIQEDRKITSTKEMEAYLNSMQLHGFGGTDFRPAFEYVNGLIKEREFSNLKGLLYFTDGEGTFPQKQPPCQTAFVFVEDASDPEKYEHVKVPAWAVKVILDEDGIRTTEV